MKSFLNVFIVFLLISLSACSSKIDFPRVKISFTGDIIMHMPVRYSAKRHNKLDKAKRVSLNNRGYDFLFEEIRPYLTKSDIVLGNMEFPIKFPFKSVPWIFNSGPEVISALKHSGFTILNIANNHILDQGHDGVSSTISHILKYGLSPIGAGKTVEEARKGVFVEKNGIKIGFLAYTGVTNYPISKKRKYRINWFYNKESVKEDIIRMKMKTDFLIMVVHAGNEYALNPEKKDSILMKEYLEAGVDLIVGHHPHILQRVDEIITKDKRRGVIFYSLGNFISNQSSVHKMRNGMNISTRDSIVLTLELIKKNDELVKKYSTLPIYTVNQKWPCRIIRVRAIADEIKRLKEKRGKVNLKEQKNIDRMIKNMLLKIKSIEKVLSITDINKSVKGTEGIASER